MIDLHCHSTASDGALSPEELVRLAKARGVEVLALTDHDTVNGLDCAALTASELGITFIPGVEVGTEGDRQIHILVYGMRECMTGTLGIINRLQEARKARVPQYLKRVADLGMSVGFEDLEVPAGTVASRPHIAAAMLKLGYVQSMGEAFDLYLGTGRAAYVPRLNIPASELIRTAALEGALPVLAHPGLIAGNNIETYAQMRHWKRDGLWGLEVYHPAHAPHQYAKWQRIADELELCVTGGSDYHRGNDDSSIHGELGSQCAVWKSKEHTLKNMLSNMHNRHEARS